MYIYGPDLKVQLRYKIQGKGNLVCLIDAMPYWLMHLLITPLLMALHFVRNSLFVQQHN